MTETGGRAAAGTSIRPLDVIIEKRSGGEHARDTLAALIDGFTAGEVPDYQMAA